MNYLQSEFSPKKRQSIEKMNEYREERKKRLTDLLNEAEYNKDKRLVEEYKMLLKRL